MLQIGFICNDQELINKFRSVEFYTDFKNGIALQDFFDTDVLLVSDKIIESNELLEFREMNTKIQHIFYIVSNEDSQVSLNSILKSQNIVMIPPKRTKKQILETVCSYTLEGLRAPQNIVTFFGADSKVGTTMIAQSIAERISALTALKVCLVFLNGKPSMEYTNNSTTWGLDTIKLSLANQMLTSEDFLDTCIKRDNLFILQGPDHIEGLRYYQPEYIEYLLETISDAFDVIIVDAGSCVNINMESGMSIAALNSTRLKFLIATQQETSLSQYLRIKQQVLDKLHITDFMLIVNKLITDDMLPTPYQVGKLFDTALAGNLPFMQWGWQCEKDKKTLAGFRDKIYLKELDKVIGLIADELKFTYTPESKHSRQSFFNKLLKIAK